MEYKKRKKAILLLSDGTIFYGKSVYGEGTAFGEVCFNTGMTGYQEIISDNLDGAPPPIDLKTEKKIIETIMTLNNNKLLTGAHDISDGGLLTATCEMLFKDRLGLNVNLPKALMSSNSKDHLLHSWCFGEDQNRIIISTNETEKVVSLLKEILIDYYILGTTNTSSNLNLNELDTISIKEIYNINESTIPSLMGSYKS